MPAIVATELQWPSRCGRPLAPFSRSTGWRDESMRHERIESWFGKRLGVRATLMPSGRSAIAALFDYLGARRGQTVFAPRWSSGCVWQAIGRVADPTVSLRPSPDFALAVHRWGVRHRMPSPGRTTVIEDSVDSAFTDGRDLFPCGGRYEVVSLPKVLGTYCGGLILSTDPRVHEFLVSRRADSRALGRRLSEVKYRRYLGKPFAKETLSALEPENRVLDSNALRHVEDCLPLLDAHCATILRRLAQAGDRLGRLALEPHSGRLPSALPLPTRLFRCRGRALPVRHFSASRRLGRDDFEPCWLLPLHFGIQERDFQQMLGSLSQLAR